MIVAIHGRACGRKTMLRQDDVHPQIARVSQDYLLHNSTLLWHSLSPDFSPIEHIWKHLGSPVGQSTCLVKLEARLQQRWSETRC
ncbi:hypothetical protein TNCV_682961 [Trichonephila clavipes]|nr:hypothetical protein TNCV_682961 [Trichonephila clavipes]